jgi:long-chain acyl-CoA synthetase
MTLQSPGAAKPCVDPSDLPLPRFYQHEAATPDAIFLSQPFDGGQMRHYSWRQAGSEVRRMAAFLRAQGWPPGSRIAILGKNSAGWVLSDLAIWMAGYVSVPLYPLLTADHIRQIVMHSDTVAAFVGKLDNPEIIEGIPGSMLTMSLPLAQPLVLEQCAMSWGDIVARNEPLTDSPVFPGSALATIVYTSGTTGASKGVMHSFDTVTSALLTITDIIDFRASDRLFSYLPLAHIMERGVVELAALHAGCQIFFAESIDTFADDLRRARPTLFVSVPRLWHKFQQGVFAKIPPGRLDTLLAVPLLGRVTRRKIVAGLGLDAVRVFASGSAPLSSDLMRWYARIGIEICEGYGMTELGCTSHGHRQGDVRIGTVGPPTDHVQHRTDPFTGEVQVLSAGAMLGYFKAPELTAQMFTDDGWLKTGDKGVIDTHGHLRIIGRLKDNFKTSKGKYVAPAPIEHRLGQHSAVESCIVLGAGLSQPLGVVVLTEAAGLTLPAAQETLSESFAAHLREVNATLDSHEQLSRLVITRAMWTPDNGLLTPTLKLKRSEIEHHFADRIEGWAEPHLPVIWADRA